MQNLIKATIFIALIPTTAAAQPTYKNNRIHNKTKNRSVNIASKDRVKERKKGHHSSVRERKKERRNNIREKRQERRSNVRERRQKHRNQ